MRHPSSRAALSLSLAAGLLLLAGVALATNAWSAIGSGIADPDGEVYAVALSGASIYIGGDFQNAGGDVDADNVAVWDGSAWQALGTAPLDGEVNALAISGANVYAGGAFEDAGGNLNADFIARWDGAQWQSLGATPMTGTAPAVYALAVDGANLYAGGDFFDAGGLADADHLARWNGSAWSALGSTPLNAPVHALAVIGTDVYAGGDFLDLGGAAGDFIARWNGSAWSALGATPLNGPVRAIAVVGADVYVGGSFTDAGGDPNADYVARWDGSQWQALGGGLTGEVRALAVMGASDLFAGGSFTSAGGNVIARRVARWNGIGWTALNPTVNDAVLALAVAGQQVYVGGRFTDAGGLANADRIARWEAAPAIPGNTAPEALDDAVTIFEDNARTISVLGNDSDPGDTLNVIAFSGLSNGTVTTVDGLTALFTPAADFNGPAGFTYTAQDTGALTDTARVNVTVQPVNDPPSVNLGPDQFINEDDGAPRTIAGWVSDPSPGPANEAGQAVTWSSAYSNPELFVIPPSVNDAGALTYQIQTPNVFGTAVITVTVTDNGGTDNGGSNTRVYPAYIFVNPVNDPPAFTPGSNQTVNEDSGLQTVAGWATGITAGPANESGQTVTFVVTNTNNALFSAQPAVAANGTLTFTPAANAFGSATVFVTIQDNGGVANGGDDTGNTETFTITVNPVNDPPSFVKGANQTVNEDSGPRTVTGWATAISPGPANESGQSVSFTVTNNNNALFSAQPAVAANGALTFTPAANAFGAATVTVAIQDNGGVANGGDDTGNTETFTVTVNAVNDAPSFIKGPDQTVNEDAVAQTVAGWATAISPGPANEASQTLTFTLSNNNTSLFSTQPALSAAGTLTFRPAKDRNGSATVSVTLSDSGGTAGGGADTSPAQTFLITVAAVNDAPVITLPPGQTTPENTPLTFSLATTNAISVTDVDAGSNTISVTLTVSDGVLSLSRVTGLTFAGGDGSLDAAMHFRGTLTNINAALNGAVFTPTAAFNGLTGIVVTSDDRGFSGSGGAQSSARTLSIDVGSVNDAPQILLPAGPLSVNEDTDLVFSAEAGAALVIDDRDASAGAISVTVAAENGVLSLNGAAGLTFLAGDGVADAALVFTGTLANVNAALDGLTFTPLPDYNGPASIALSVDDQGNTGDPRIPLTDADAVAFQVLPVNDAPFFLPGPDLSVYREDGAHTAPGWATAISPGPADEAGQALTFTLSVDNPALFTIPPAIDPATGALTFTPAPDQEGVAAVTVMLSDDGGTAGGGADASPPHVFTITISPRPIFYLFLPVIRR